MPDRPKLAFADRQAQWDAFHAWESTGKAAPLPLEDRLAWYFEAFTLSRMFSSSADREHLQTKVREIQEARCCLAHLKSVRDDA
jgi:hypothetical protein